MIDNACYSSIKIRLLVGVKSMWTMANLKYGEKNDFEALLGMRTGYVLDFTNRQFREFVLDSVRLDIEDPVIGSTGSKAVRLRHFWNNQPDHIVGRLMNDLVERTSEENAVLRKRCIAAAERLSKSAAVQDASVISEFSGVEEFEQLAAGVRQIAHVYREICPLGVPAPRFNRRSG